MTNKQIKYLFGSLIIFFFFFTSLGRAQASIPVISLKINEEEFTPKNQWCLDLINTSIAWNITKGSEEIIIAVLDTGVDWLHPELEHCIWTNPLEIPGDGIDNDGNGFVDDVHGFDFGDGDPNPMDSPRGDDNDDQGHGTHCAGIIAALADEHGTSGVAPGITIMPIRLSFGIIPENPELAGSTLDAVNYAVMMGANVISASYGGYGLSPMEESTYINAIDNQVAVVAATGNDDANMTADPFYPTGFSGVISVGSVCKNSTRVWYSNYGDCIDIVAPGYLIMGLAPINTGKENVVSIGEILLESNAMTGSPYTSDEGITKPLVYCQVGAPGQFPSDVSGNIALIDRGGDDNLNFHGYFHEKVENAASAGAVGVIITNNVPGMFSGTLNVEEEGGLPDPSCPAVSISQEDGDWLKAKMANKTVEAYIRNVIGNYTMMSGTSMAGPHVSAAVGLIMSANPDLKSDVQIVKYILTNTARDLGEPGWDQFYGYGLLNVGLAVKASIDYSTPEVKSATATWIEGSTNASIEIEFDDISGIKTGHFYYREKGKTDWETVNLNYIPSPEVFNTTIGPFTDDTVTIEYYIEMSDFRDLFGNKYTSGYPGELEFLIEETSEATTSESVSTPGFELILVISAIAVITIMLRKRRNL